MKIANFRRGLLLCSGLMLLTLPAAAQMGMGEAATAMGAAAANNAAAVQQGAAVTATAQNTVQSANTLATTGAAPAAAPTVVPPATTTTAAAPAVSPAAPPPTMPSEIMLDAGTDDLGMPPLPVAAGSANPGLAAAEDKKAPEAVKNVMKRLNSSTSNITLEDLNAAREAVARIDMMIELEKKLKDLSEVRKDRKGADPFEDAIPASALSQKFAPPPAPTLFPTNPSPPPPPVPSFSSFGDVVVERIMGAGGRYAAMVKVGGDRAQLVRVGDELSDGSKVEAIGDEGVTVVRDKKSKTYKVRNVNNIFSSR